MSTPLTEEKLAAIRERHAAASRGPWYWSGYTRGQQLGLHGPRMSSVMEFWRWGMRSAQPVFCVDGILHGAAELAAPDTNPHRGRITDINHPDARFLAASWQDVRDLLAHVAALESAAATAQGLLDLLGDFLSTLASTPRNPYPDEDDPRAAGWADALDAVQEGANALTGALNAARASRPTPAQPGLLAVVGREFATLKDGAQFRQVLATDADALGASMGIPTVQWAHLLTWLERRIHSAVDAAKHEEMERAGKDGAQ